MRRGLLGLAAALVAAGAHADPAPGGWYGAIDLGAHLRQDGPTWGEVRELGAVPAAPRFHTDLAFAAYGRIGYRISPRLRLELEAGWRSNRLLSIVDEYQSGRPPGSITAICAPIVAGPAPHCGAPAGGLDAVSAIGNAVIDLGPRQRIDPFVGGGVGVVHVRLRTQGAFYGPSGPLSPPGSIAIDASDSRLAYQALGGVAVRINDRWSADVTYRFLDSFSHRWKTTSFGDIRLGRISGKYEGHSLTLGLRFRL